MGGNSVISVVSLPDSSKCMFCVIWVTDSNEIHGLMPSLTFTINEKLVLIVTEDELKDGKEICLQSLIDEFISVRRPEYKEF